jgi:serine/threonine protein kinase
MLYYLHSKLIDILLPDEEMVMLREGLQIDHYQIIRLLGSGGMGEVYLAQDTRVARKVAIKVVRNEPDSYPHAGTPQDDIRLFEREMKAITALDHPNILPLYDFGEENINHAVFTYMVMPFRSEGSLTDWLNSQQKKALHLQDVLFLIHQAASALQHTHNHNLMHLDVKPSNFLVRRREDTSDSFDLLLADFGISKFNTATMTASHSIRGTPVYMAPEQWTGTPVPASDQYALAVMAYQFIAGRPPFQGNMQQMMYQHIQEVPKPPSNYNSHISKAVDDVLLRALAKKPEDRFPSIMEFAHALARSLSHEEALTPIPKTLQAGEMLAANQSEFPKEQLFPGTLYATSQVVKQSKKPSMPFFIIISLIFVVILAISGVVIFFLHNVPSSSDAKITSNNTPTSVPTTIPATITATSSSYYRLKSLYTGTASGYASATITFTLALEDKQGNVSMMVTFQRTDDPSKFARYLCNGTLSVDNKLHLSCRNGSFLVTIDGFIYADGHMEGTWLTTEDNNPNYNHFYKWVVS